MIDLPTAFQDMFNGESLAAKTSLSAMLSTVDAEGWPHLSFLSAGEVLVGDGTIGLMLWGQAHSTTALEQQRRGVLFVAGDGVVHEARLEVTSVDRAPERPTAIILARPDALRQHRAPYATVQSMIGFELDDPAATVARWEHQIAALRTALANAQTLQVS